MITKRTFTLFLYGSLLLLLAGCQLQLPDGTMMTNGAIADGQAEVMSETAMEEDVAEDEAVADEGEAATEEVAEETYLYYATYYGVKDVPPPPQNKIYVGYSEDK